MDLSNLPLELVDAIAVYLSFEDVCACSEVNTQWKQAFNLNSIWKRFCFFHPNYFDCQVSKLKCSPMIEDCKSKIQAFNEFSVRSNHLSGSFHITEVPYGSLYCDSVLDFVDDVGNHWLFMSCMDGMMFESEHYVYVWNMNDGASLHCQIKTPVGKIGRIFLSEIKMLKDKLFIAFENNALIYEFAYPVYKLKFINKVVLKQNSVPDLINNIKILTVGNCIVGGLHSNTHAQEKLTPLIYVWNADGVLIYNKQSKLHRLRDIANSQFYPVCYMHSNDIDKLIFAIKVERTCFIILMFDVSLLQFTDFFVEKQNIELCSLDIFGNIVSLLYVEERTNLIIECYTVGDCKLIFNIQLENKDLPFHALVKGTDCGDLIFFTDKTFCVFNLSTKKQISSFKALRGRQCGLTVLSSVLLMIRSKIGNNICHEVWNYKSGSILYVLDFPFSPDFKQNYYKFTCVQNYIYPPKIIAYKDPLANYPIYSKSNMFVVISFW